MVAVGLEFGLHREEKLEKAPVSELVSFVRGRN